MFPNSDIFKGVIILTVCERMRIGADAQRMRRGQVTNTQRIRRVVLAR